jgi:hypothetical protein
MLQLHSKYQSYAAVSEIKLIRFVAFSKQNTKLNLTFSKIFVSVDTTLGHLRFTGTTRTEKIFPINFGTSTVVLTVSVQCFHMTLHNILLY